MTTYWQTWAAAGLADAAGQRDPARRGVLDRPRAHLLVRAAQAPRAQPRARGRRQDALLPPLSVRPARRARRRLLDGRPLAHGARAVAERLPDRLEREPLDARRQGARRAPRRARPGQQRRDDARPRRPAAGARAARDELRRGRRARPAHREGARHGIVAGLRPEPRRERTYGAHRGHHRELHPGRAAPQPRERRALHPGLDVQGRSPPPRRSSRESSGRSRRFYDPGYCTVYGKQVHNFADQDGPEVFGTINLVDGPRALGQLGVLQHRPEARRQARSSTRPSASASTSARRSRLPRTSACPSGLYRNGKLYYPQGRLRTSTPGRMAFGQERMLVTPLQMAMVAGATRLRREADGAAGRRPDRRSRRARSSRSSSPTVIRQAVSQRTAHQVAAMMRLAVARGHRHGRADPRIHGRRQDGNGRDRRRGLEHDVVHRLRRTGRRRPARGRHRRRAPEPERRRAATTAAPIARAVMQAILQGTENP